MSVHIHRGNPESISRLDHAVWLGNASQQLLMVAAGAQRLVDLRSETTPPRLDVPIDHLPIQDLIDDQDGLILAAAEHVRRLVADGTTVGIYCLAGVSRTSTVAIAYLMLGGAPLREAEATLRRIRPIALPAMQLWRSLERLEEVALERSTRLSR